MKYIMGIITVLLLTVNCQKEKNKNVESSGLEKSIENILQVSDSTKHETGQVLTPDSNMIVPETDSQTVEKLSRLKPTDYSTLASSSDLWNAYNKLKDEITFYKNNWNFPELMKLLNQAAEIAQKLKRPDIASWQFNNIGFYSIQEYRKRTDYANRMEDIAAMPDGAERNQYIQETKDILRSEIELLNNAEQSLYDAIELDNQEPDKNRQDTINNNLNFIATVNNFINN